MGYYALKFLFTQIYHKEWASEYLPTPKVAKTLPPGALSGRSGETLLSKGSQGRWSPGLGTESFLERDIQHDTII